MFTTWDGGDNLMEENLGKDLSYCDALRNLVSVFIWGLYDYSNVSEYILTPFSIFMSFLSVCLS